ncbi:hypothetical protein IWW48_002798 [Coemansia sp. RSA 1200]|nr:hypothetical protein IWW48_002798 [Coemansia sp. RSA 1200]
MVNNNQQPQQQHQQPSLEEIVSAARLAAAEIAASSASSMPPHQQQQQQQQQQQNHYQSLESPVEPNPLLPMHSLGNSGGGSKTVSASAAVSSNVGGGNGGNGGGPNKPIGMACRACRLRKIRCGGERPRCTYCVKKGYECVLTPHKKRGRPRKDSQRGKQQQQQQQKQQQNASEGDTATVDDANVQRREPRSKKKQQSRDWQRRVEADELPLAVTAGDDVLSDEIMDIGDSDEGSNDRRYAADGGGMRAMAIPAMDGNQYQYQNQQPLSLSLPSQQQGNGDLTLDGLLDIVDVRQLWAELTGLQGLDLPPELLALAANSATQPIDATPSSIPTIGPSFNFGLVTPVTGQPPAGNHDNSSILGASSAQNNHNSISLAQRQNQEFLLSATSSAPLIPPPLHAAGTTTTGSDLYQTPLAFPLPLAGSGDSTLPMDAETANATLFASNYAFPRHATADPDGMSPPTTAPAAQQRFTDSPVSSASRSAADGSASAAYLASHPAEKSQRQRKKQAAQPQSYATHAARSVSDGRASPAATTASTTATTDQGRRAPLAAAANASRARSESSSQTAAAAAATGADKDAHYGLPTIRRTVDEGVRMYFVYVHPWLPILHRPTFERQIVEGRVDPILYYAVQAVAARFRNQNQAQNQKQQRNQNQQNQNQQSGPGLSARKPYKRGQRYAKAARTLLPGALRSARLSTLQAITILALYMSVSGHWQEGAAYERLAVQLAFIGQFHLLDEEFLLPPVTNNMGLYESGWSEHSHPARLEVLSRPGGVLEHEQRRRAWWSVFQLERFNGLAMGRPPIIKPGWHWVWLPCSEELWARENPSGALAWEMGLADYTQRPAASVSNCRVDLILALIMGQLIDQRTELFRLFFPRVDRGTLFYDNLPTHALPWPARLRKLCAAVTALERRIRQWRGELDRYADSFSARRHANFEIMGASCQIHLYACVLQIREHLFEDLLVSEEARTASAVSAAAAVSGNDAEVDPDADDDARSTSASDRASSSRNSSSLDMAAVFERHMGEPFDRSAYQRGYVAKAKRPQMSLQFVHDLDILAQRCWDRSVARADEIARLLRVHWLRPFEQQQPAAAADSAAAASASANALGDEADDGDGDLMSFISSSGLGGTAASASASAGDSLGDANNQTQKKPLRTPANPGKPSVGSAGSSTSSAPIVDLIDPQIADRFKLMNPQTPYHLFVAGKVQAARLKQAVTAHQNARRKKSGAGAKKDEMDVEDDLSPTATAMDIDNPDNNKSNSNSTSAGGNGTADDLSPEVVADAVRRINDIWDTHGLAADAKAVSARLDDIITALEYSQLFWNSLNFASHLRYLKREAAKPLLSTVFRK